MTKKCECHCSCCGPAPLVPRKWAKLIHQWADGAEIQFSNPSTSGWRDCVGNKPSWSTTANCKYRVKPNNSAEIAQINKQIDVCDRDLARLANKADNIAERLTIELQIRSDLILKLNQL